MRTGPLYAVKKYCLWCCGDQPKEVKLCPAQDCPIHPLRQGKKPDNFKKSVLQAIKERCYDCSCFEWKRVKECDFVDCALYPYRLGKNPKRQGIGNSQYKPLLQKDTPQNSTVKEGILEKVCSE
jgi:hypothetical protein